MISTTSLVENKKMSNLTWFGVGGSSKYYFQPSSEMNLVSFLKNNQLDLPIYPLGAGSNIIIRDRGFNGIIIHFNELKEIFINKQNIDKIWLLSKYYLMKKGFKNRYDSININLKDEEKSNLLNS